MTDSQAWTERARCEGVAELYRVVFAPRPGDTLFDLRKRFDELLTSFPPPASTTAHEIGAGGVPALRVLAPCADGGRAVLWFHGGGYSIGSSRGYIGLAGRLSAACRAAVIVPDYRLAPEHRFPAAVDDAVAAASWLIDSYGAESSYLGGDSAGGALTIAALCGLRDNGADLPVAAATVSPLADLTASAGSYQANQAHDTALSAAAVRNVCRTYLRTHDPTDPMASPIFGDLAGLPPVLVLASSTEVLLDDARELVRRITDSRGLATLVLYQGMVHAWPLFAPAVAEGDTALRQIAEFFSSSSRIAAGH